MDNFTRQIKVTNLVKPKLDMVVLFKVKTLSITYPATSNIIKPASKVVKSDLWSQSVI